MKAMAQLIRMTIQSGTSLNFKWPYQAKVMNTLEHSSKAIGISGAGMAREGMGRVRVGCDGGGIGAYHVPTARKSGGGNGSPMHKRAGTLRRQAAADLGRSSCKPLPSSCR